MKPTPEVHVLFDFSDESQTALWRPVNDVIMGGVSIGEMKRHSPDSAVFTGVVSLEQGGGFASVRTVPSGYNMEGFCGVVLSVRGDGKTYKFNLTDNRSPVDVLYQARFETKRHEWMDVRISFADCVPTFRGRRLQDHPPLDQRTVRTFGLMISEKQSGPFALEISRITLFA